MQAPPISSLCCRSTCESGSQPTSCSCACNDSVNVIINENVPTDCSKCTGVFVNINTGGGPPPTPADTTIIQLAINVDGSMWVWDPTTQTWITITPSSQSDIYVENTVADLRGVNDNGSLRYAITLGNMAVGDGQNRTYYWDATETAPDDGISIIRPTSQAPGALGAWKEL